MGYRIIMFALLIAAVVVACVAFYFNGTIEQKRKFYHAKLDALDVCEAVMNEKHADKLRDRDQKLMDAGFGNGIRFAMETLKSTEEARNV